VEILLASGDGEEVVQEVLRFCKGLVGWLRARVLETLLTFGDEVLMPAVALLDHEDEDIRTAALVLAENFDDPRIVGPVSKLLKDDDWWLRISACDSLGRIGDKRAVAALVEALKDDDARWAAIDALARIGSKKALKPLAGLLRDDRVEVRTEVIKAFSCFSDKRLLGVLKSVKEKDPSSEVRTRAAEVLRDMAAKLDVDVGDAEEGTSAIQSSHLKNPIDKLLAKAREMGCSDLHITVDEPPIVRDKGVLRRLDMKPVSKKMCSKSIRALLKPRQLKLLEEQGHVDLCHAIPEVGRYRANVYRQRRGLCAAFRVIPNLPPTFADLRLPGQLTQLLDYHQGIICVSGPAASGKSTTLAAIINLINETKPLHIITLEDPIEFVHPVKTALVNQREVGSHTVSFARALRGALREDPDVIMVGEMRDPETVRMALEAAETGHLVIATLHTTSAISTVERIVKSFPPDEQASVRMGLSESLKYVLSQQLIRRKDGQGRVAIYEVLKGTFSIGSLIRDNKTYQIPGMMQIGRNQGMQTVDMALMDLVEADLVSPEDAWRRAAKPETFEPLCDPAFLRARHPGAANETEEEVT
jgi:twitching motility protein PilT